MKAKKNKQKKQKMINQNHTIVLYASFRKKLQIIQNVKKLEENYERRSRNLRRVSLQMFYKNKILVK
jgi:hypothetical protein